VKRVSAALVLLALGLLAGCSSSSSNPLTLSAIQVTPSSATVAQGQTQAYTAMASYSDGTTKDVTATVSWSSSSMAIATISSAGVATGTGQGTATLTASMSGVSGTAQLTVTAPILVSIAVTPDTPTLSPGMFQQFTATGTYSDGSTKDLTATASWDSDTSAVATITADGYLTARTLGTSTISAASGSVTGMTQLTVAPPTLTSIQIVGGDLSIAAGTSYGFIALGVYSDGGRRNVSGQVTWASSHTDIATISPVGVATGVKAGTSMVSATMGPVSQSITLTVTSATVSVLAIAPSTKTIEPFTKQPFTATAVLSDTTTQVITSFVHWDSSVPGVASVSNTSQIGVATGLGPGITSISATSASANAAVPLSVSSATLTGLTLSPTTSTMAVGSTLSFRITAQYSDGASIPVGTAVDWSSSDPTVAGVNAQGTITGAKPGTVTITAKLNGMTANATLSVETLNSMAITPATLQVAVGTFLRFTATGTLSDGTTQDLTASVTWTSSSPAVAIMSNVPGTVGGAVGLSAGTSTIGAVLNGVVGAAKVTVTGATLTSIALTPANPSIALGESQQFKAVGTFSDGTTETLSNQVAWTSSDVTVAMINATGAATSSGTGTTTISATLGGVSASTVLTVQ
jgi:uncharacterized protein YjdB